MNKIQRERYIELATLADAAAAACQWEHEIVEAIMDGDGEDLNRQRLADSFRFPAREMANDGDRFGPIATSENSVINQIPVTEVADKTCSVWAAIVEHATHPRVRARLHDLLFERRWGDVGAYGVGAIEAYVADAAQVDPPSLRTVDALRRASRLARLTRREDLASRVIAQLLHSARASLDDPSPKPGVALRLIEVLVEARCEDPAVDELLERARVRYSDAWNVESVIDLQRRRASTHEARKALDRELVEAWLAEADRANPLAAVIHREKAARLARERGLPDLVDRAVVAMQSADPPELARISVEVPSSTTPEQIDEYIESMVGKTWWESVTRILAQGPPTGAVEHNRDLASNLAREHPLQALLPAVRLGGDGLPRYTPKSDEDLFDDQLTHVETMALHWQGQLLAEVLRRAGARHSPSTDEVVEALRAVKCEGATAAAIGRLVHRFNDGDFEGATYTGIPLIERQCRALLLAVDAPLYRVQRERTPGTYPGLGTLLPLLADRGLDESWYRFLRTFLSAPNGWNYRNEALHGFIEDVDAIGAALVLISVLYVTHLGPQRVDDAEDAE